LSRYLDVIKRCGASQRERLRDFLAHLARDRIALRVVGAWSIAESRHIAPATPLE